MKRLLILALTLILLLTLFGCATGAPSTTTRANNGIATATTAAGKAGAMADSAAPNEAASNDADTARKIVKNAEVSLAVKDVKAAYDELLAYARARGGYETNRNQRTINGVMNMSAQIKIKPEELDAFLDFAGTKGEVLSSHTSTDDITESYYDAQTRLKTMEKSLVTYYDFLTKTKTIDESLSVQKQINQLTQEIESLKGRISRWNSLLAESTVTFNITQLVDPVKTKKEINWSTLSFDDMGYLMQAGLTGLLNFLANVLQWSAIALVVAVPIWLPVLIILVIIRNRNKKRRAQRAAAMKEATPEVTAANENDGPETDEKHPEA